MFILLLLLPPVFLIAKHRIDYSPGKFTVNEGQIQKSDTESIEVKYNRKSSSSFYVSLDFELQEGRIDWEILNPEGQTEFAGYIVNENGKTFRQLTYPSDYELGSFNKKLEVSKVDFDPLDIYDDSPFGYCKTGVYKLV